METAYYNIPTVWVVCFEMVVTTVRPNKLLMVLCLVSHLHHSAYNMSIAKVHVRSTMEQLRLILEDMIGNATIPIRI